MNFLMVESTRIVPRRLVARIEGSMFK
jgi:hypothetical protein